MSRGLRVQAIKAGKAWRQRQFGAGIQEAEIVQKAGLEHKPQGLHYSDLLSRPRLYLPMTPQSPQNGTTSCGPNVWTHKPKGHIALANRNRKQGTEGGEG